MGKLVGFGFKVSVVEQTETPEEMAKRIKSSGKKEKLINRELVNVMTKGTFMPKDADAEGRYLLTIRLGELYEYAVVFLESTTNIITISYQKNDTNYTTLKTLICMFKPLEVVYDEHNMQKDVIQIFKSQYIMPVFSRLGGDKQNWMPGIFEMLMKNSFGEPTEKKWSSLLEKIYNDKERLPLCFSALSGRGKEDV